MKYTIESISGFLKIVNNYLLFFALGSLCIYIWRVQNNKPEIEAKKKLDEYYERELYETYKFNLNPIYATLEEGYSDYIQEIENSMRLDCYNKREITEIESRSYSRVIKDMHISDDEKKELKKK